TFGFMLLMPPARSIPAIGRGALVVPEPGRVAPPQISSVRPRHFGQGAVADCRAAARRIGQPLETIKAVHRLPGWLPGPRTLVQATQIERGDDLVVQVRLSLGQDH